MDAPKCCCFDVVVMTATHALCATRLLNTRCMTAGMSWDTSYSNIHCVQMLVHMELLMHALAN